MALVASHITVRSGPSTLLDDVSMTINSGELVGVIGPNGAGKTTLFNAISGARLADSGTVSYDGEALRPMSPRTLAQHRAILPQSQQTAFNYTVREILALGIDAQAAHRANELLAQTADALDIAKFLDRNAANLSGGERQRVRLGRALLHIQSTNARYLLLDEPTSAQDPGRATLLANYFRSYAQHAKIGVLLIVHDLNLAARCCDRIIVLKHGRLLAAGTPSDILHETLITTVFGPGLRVLSQKDAPPIILPTALSLDANTIT